MSRRPQHLTTGQLIAVVAGNALEFYDFVIFGFFAIQIGQVFFPGESETASLLKILAVFGAGFLTRPLGGWVMGRLGDRLGRKPAMLASFGLMGVAAAGLALTPSYESIGLAAPVLAVTFRLLQGFALGGEVGPTTAFLLEAAPRRHRGFYVSLQNATQYLSVLCVGLVGALLSGTLAPQAFGAWGWRAAMLLGAAMVPVAWSLRRRLPETLEAAPDPQAQAPAPLLRVAGLGVLMIAANSISTYLMNYMGTYAQHTLHVGQQPAFILTVVSGSSAMAGALAGGALSDRFGRKPVMIGGGIMALLLGVPCFAAMLLWTSPGVMPAAAGLVSFFIGVFPPALLANVAESFPAGRRAGAIGVTYALAVAIFGGSAQLIVTWLIDWTGSPLAPAWYMSGAMAMGLAAMAAMRETAPAKAGASAGSG